MKTDLSNLADLIIFLSDTPIIISDKDNVIPQIAIKALHNKPYLQIGPFWVKTNKGKYDIYMWDKVMGKLRYRISVWFNTNEEDDSDNIHIKTMHGIKDPKNWWIL